MKKLIVAALLIVALVLLGAPALLGQRAHDALALQLEALSGPQATLTLADWKQGWFRSSGRVRTSFSASSRATLKDVAALAPLAGGIDSEIELAHGPLIFDDGLQLALYRFVIRPGDNPAIDAWAQRLSVQDLFVTRGEMALDGSTRFVGSVPAFSTSLDDLEIDFSGMSQTVKVSAGGERIEFSGEAAELELYSSSEGSLSLAGLQVTGHGVPHEVLMLVGPVNMTIESLELRNPDSGLLIEDIVLSGDTEISGGGDHFGGTVRYGAALIDVTGVPEIRDASLELSLRQLDLDFYARYTELLASLDPQDETDDARLLMELEALLPQLVAGSPGMTIGPLSARIDGAPLQARLALDLDASVLPAGLDSSRPEQLLPALVAEGHLQVPESMALELARAQVAEALVMQVEAGLLSEVEAMAMAEQQAPLMLEQLQQQSLLRLMNDGGYRVDVALRGGALQVNGQPVPLPPLGAGMP